MPLTGDEKKLVTQLIETMPRPKARVDAIIVGEKFIGVVADGHMGLSSLLGARPNDHEKNKLQELQGAPLSRAVSLVDSSSPFSLALGLAALNAGTTPDKEKLEDSDLPADDLIARLGKDKTVGLVGDFPFTQSLAQRVGYLHLFELNPVPGALPRDQWEATLPQLDVLALTATTLLSRHMAWYLTRATRAKIIILGPTTPMSPALFGWGADYLCGSVVTDVERVTASLESGSCFRSIKQNGGIRFVQWEK